MKLKRLTARSTIYDAWFSVRVQNCLDAAGIENVGQLCNWTASELLDLRNFGDNSINEVRERLWKDGLTLKGD